MFRRALCAGSSLCVLSPLQERAHVQAASIASKSRLDAASVRRWSSPKATVIAASASSSDDDDGDVDETASPPPPPTQPLAQNPFYSFMPSTPASRVAAASGASLAPAPRPARVCRRCDGCGDVACRSCSGRGSLPRGGYSRKNALNSNKAVGTTWTALQRTLGRTHFDCRGKRVIGGGGGGGGEGGNKKKKGQTYFLMVATCDDEIRLWVPQATLKDRGAWAAGWLAREDLVALRREVNGEEGEGGRGEGGDGGSGSEGGESGSESEGPRRGASCKKCEGTGKVPCPLCSRAGEMIHV